MHIEPGVLAAQTVYSASGTPLITTGGSPPSWTGVVLVADVTVEVLLICVVVTSIDVVLPSLAKPLQSASRW
jgi:hypothetical protein